MVRRLDLTEEVNAPEPMVLPCAGTMQHGVAALARAMHFSPAVE